MAKNENADVLHKRIVDDNLCGLFVFTGEEKYLRRSAKNAILKKFADDPAGEFNIHKFDADKINPKNVAEAVESYPVMADRKLVVIENSKLFKTVSEENKTIWQDIIDNLPDDVCLVFDEEEIDGRSGLLKKAKAKGLYVEFQYKTPAELVNFCGKMFSQAGIKITNKAIEQLVFQCDEGLENVENEVNKLISYCADKKEVTEEDVSIMVRKSLQNRIFKMIDEIFDRNSAAVFEMLGELKIFKESPVKIIALIGGQISRLLKTSILLADGRGADVASAIKMSPYVAKMYIEKARTKSTDQFSTMLNDCLNADYMIKNGSVDEWTSIEILIAKLLKA